MNEEKQIEEMALTMCEGCATYTRGCEHTPCDTVIDSAAYLYNAGYRKQSEGEWISVEERLPEPLERVVAFDSRGNMFTAVYISHMTGKNAWCSPLCYCGEVTHWMPLPEPPENP